MRVSFVRLLATAVVFPTAIAAAAAPPSAALDELIGRALRARTTAEDLRVLVDNIGGRPTGSAALERAVDWAVTRFRAAGVDSVRAEPYRAPRLWLPLKESAAIVAPEAAPLAVAAMPFAHDTPAGGIEADVVDVGRGDDAAFAAARGKLAGRFALVHTEPMRTIEDLFKDYMETPPLFARAHKAAVAGILYMSTRPQRLLYRHNTTIDGNTSPEPAALVEREGALRLARLVATGERVRVRLTIASRAPVDAPARNVVAELRGREHPDEIVILGAHLDSWDLGRGALDNGCNVALVLEVARQLAAQAQRGLRPRRTVRFVLYTGEEQSMWGSLADVRAHRAELDRVRAQIVFDEGSGRTTGFSLGGRTDLLPAVAAALAPLGALGPFTQTLDAFVGTDNYDYLVEGVPTLVAIQEAAPYLPDYHAASDTFDKVDLRELATNVAVAAAVTFALADGEAAPAPRQSRAEVEALVKATGLEQQMRIYNLWPAFTAGNRGRAPR
jgi:Zn-dependent M28 family amino/carboxypeptidase